MILLIDVGNSRIKWRLLDNGQIFSGGQYAHQGNITDDVLMKMWGALGAPESVWGVNVSNPQIAEKTNQWISSRWGLETHFISASRHLCNVTNGYTQPERLGADRWMAMIGASRIAPGACCVADCGTAVTVDCLTQNHEHIGGLIIPGLLMMPRCVSNNTARVTFNQKENSFLGRDTSECLSSGAMHSIVGALQRVKSLMEQHASPMTCLITGGDALQLLPWLDNGWHYEPDLIFIGLTAAIQVEKG